MERVREGRSLQGIDREEVERIIRWSKGVVEKKGGQREGGRIWKGSGDGGKEEEW